VAQSIRQPVLPRIMVEFGSAHLQLVTGQQYLMAEADGHTV
jgi:hypothetical protein